MTEKDVREFFKREDKCFRSIMPYLLTLEQDELVTSAQALSMPTGNVADFNPGNNTIKPSDAVN